MKVTVALLLLLSVHLVLASECQAGWEKFQHDCYKFQPNVNNWQAAADSCASSKAQLPVIRNSQVDQWLVTQMKKRGTGGFWLGGKSYNNHKQWRWEPSGHLIDYFNWAKGEPSHPLTEHCLESASFYGFKWNDAACALKLRFACQKPASMVTEVTEVTAVTKESPVKEVTPITSVTVKGVELQGNRYYFSSELKTWKEAQVTCARNKAHLAVVKDHQVNQYLVAQMLKHSIKELWLGGTYVANGGYWEWKHSGERISGYFNWGEGQPSSPSIQKCLAIWADLLFQWNDAECEDTRHFVCQKAV